ncbi:MAG: hypothetical protein SGI83_06850 [Bacteroidota bacterium]|nr:hypothetical protein [Bacteroidota bacterium]
MTLIALVAMPALASNGCGKKRQRKKHRPDAKLTSVIQKTVMTANAIRNVWTCQVVPKR